MSDYFVAVYDFEAENTAELTLREGDVVAVLSRDGEWWEGRLPDGSVGLFPANHVEPYDSGAGEEEKAEGEGAAAAARPKPFMSPGPVYTSNPLVSENTTSSSSSRAVPGAAAAAAPAATSSKNAMQTQRMKENTLVSQKPTTRFGQWASNMALLAAFVNGLLGLAAIIWGAKDSARGALYIIIGLYTIVQSMFMGLFETTKGLKRSGNKLPLRAIVYFVLHIPMYLAVPTVFAATFLLTVAVGNAVSAYHGEEYDDTPPEKRPRSKLEAAAKGGGGGGGGGSAAAAPAAKLSWGERFTKWVIVQRESNSGGTTTFLSLYVASNVIIFFWALAVWVEKNNDFPDDERLSQWAPLAKAFGNVLDWNCSIILLPVLRTLIRILYNVSTGSNGCFARMLRGLLKIVPLDRALDMHKLIAKVIAIQALGHTVMHLFNYVNAQNHTMEKFGVWPWITGGIVFVAMLLMYGAVFDNVKRDHFEIFWYSHHCFIVFFVGLLLHGADYWNPNFWKWFVGPGLLYVLERYLRYRRARKPVVLLSVTNMRPDVVSLEFAKEGVFADDYNDGQYIFICCPTVSGTEWHPFTISSAPSEKTVTVHIKKSVPGSWTQQVADYLSTMGPARATYFELTRQTARGLVPGKVVGPDSRPLLQIDGPHSAPTQHVSEYDTSMVIGSGIGVTPVAATLKSVVLHRWKYFMGRTYPDNLYVFWVCSHKDVDSFRWFIRAIKDCEDEVYDMRAKNPQDMQAKRLSISIYVTSVPKGGGVTDVVVDDDIGFWGVPKEDRFLDKVRAPFDELDLYKAMKSPQEGQRMGDVTIHSGRPNWNKPFAAISEAHPSNSNIGVAFCGNPRIAAALGDACFKWSSSEASRYFTLHKENF